MAFEYSPKEFIKMYRKFLNWEWYTDTNTKALFIHCLLRANWKAGQWKGIHYKAGEFITSLPSMAEETGLSVQSVRTSLKHLISTGELTSRITDTVTGKQLARCRIITVNNWNEYQGDNRQKRSVATGKSTGIQQGANSVLTADKEHIRSISKKEKEMALPVSPDGDPAAAETDDGFPDLDDIPEVAIWKMTPEEFEEWKKNNGSTI